MTPGIPEYLSGSSPVTVLVVAPPLFLLALAANLGLYGPGVILIREAKVRWKQGWGSVLLMGAAYGILEEGVALSTLFYSKAGPVGSLGFYGHWMGVNWVWTAGILLVHAVLSIALPILLLDLALPETVGKSLVRGRELGILAIWAVDILLLMLIVILGEHFWLGLPLLGASFAAIGVLLWAAWRAPATLIEPTKRLPTRSPLALGILGVLFFPAMLLAEGLSASAHLSPILAIALVAASEGGLLFAVLRSIGREQNRRHLVALAAGILATIAVFGLVSQLYLPLVLLVDVLLFVFLRRLWRAHPDRPGPPAPSLMVAA